VEKKRWEGPIWLAVGARNGSTASLESAFSINARPNQLKAARGVEKRAVEQ
jgi:hypothetical protein